MQHPEIFSATLGLHHPWQITDVTFAKEEGRLDITVALAGEGVIICPTCGQEGATCATARETWFHADFFRYQTYLHACVPNVECSCCGVSQLERPWSRAGSRFALLR